MNRIDCQSSDCPYRGAAVELDDATVSGDERRRRRGPLGIG